MKKSIFLSSVSLMILQTGAIFGLGGGIAAIGSAPAFAADADEGQRDTVVVTGTRIKRPNLQSVSPITSVYSKEVQISFHSLRLGKMRTRQMVQPEHHLSTFVVLVLVVTLY